ncbi:MAG TPA: hypothetical protein VJT72_12260 [Pseudonocardiaceae bacterium]|nr:hypothetical protein [Pseudonocardiaceae bacterium]
MDTISPVHADAFRLLLADLHDQATPHGNCRTCPSPWPCPVVTTIHALIKDPDREFAAILRRANDRA